MGCIPRLSNPASGQRPADRRGARSGFTLIELLIALAIIAAILAIGIPVLNSVRKRSAVETARGLVNAVSAAVAGYQVKAWTVVLPAVGAPGDPVPTATFPMWDCNQDHLLDGDPAKDAAGRLDPGQRTALIASGYRGFFAMAQPTVSRRLVKDGRIVDPWGTPLRIAWAADVYGAAGYGVWSAGPDRKDELTPGVPPADLPTVKRDNILSWNAGE
jgi:prepilin-type N-terminal cleavage/methylation domain-containing protein